MIGYRVYSMRALDLHAMLQDERMFACNSLFLIGRSGVVGNWQTYLGGYIRQGLNYLRLHHRLPFSGTSTGEPEHLTFAKKPRIPFREAARGRTPRTNGKGSREKFENPFPGGICIDSPPLPGVRRPPSDGGIRVLAPASPLVLYSFTC